MGVSHRAMTRNNKTNKMRVASMTTRNFSFPLTIEWSDIERLFEKFVGPELWFSPVDYLDSGACEAGMLEEQFFKERLVYDPSLDVLHVRYRYDYEVDTEKIREPIHLVRWTLHLLGKSWMSTRFVEEFVRKVCEIKGWNPSASKWKKVP